MAKGTGKLRIENNTKVLTSLREKGVATKKEIADETALTIATAGTILNDFVALEIIKEDEKLANGKGRPTVSYQINPDHHAMLIVLIYREGKKNYLRYRLYDALHRTIDEGSQVLGIITPEFVIQRISTIISSYSQTIGQVALYLPGIVEESKVVSSDIKEIVNWDIKTLLENRTNLPILIESSYGALAKGIRQYSSLTYTVLDDSAITVYSSIKDDSGAIKVIDYSFLSQFRKRNSTYVEFNEENVGELLLLMNLSFEPKAMILSGDALDKIDIKTVSRNLKSVIPNYRTVELFTLEHNVETLFAGAVQTTSTYFWNWYGKQDFSRLL